MTIRLKLIAGVALAAASFGLAGSAQAQTKEVQMLHWWTSGGEAAALAVIKKSLADQGYSWKDVPVAGGGGDAAMTALKAMVAAGNYPTSSQMLGYTVLDFAKQGVMGDLTDLAKSEGWDKAIPAPLQKFSVYEGKWVAVPVNVHSVNWLWMNKAVMDKIGGTQPKTFDDLIALLDKAKKAGVTPLALGGQNWQEATMFDSVVLSTGGPDFYKKAFNDLDDASLKSDTMKKSFDNLAKLITYVDPNFAGRDWNLATAMVIKGDALVQVMGDWAKGEFKAAGKAPGTDYLCYRFPGTDGSVVYNSDMFAMSTCRLTARMRRPPSPRPRNRRTCKLPSTSSRARCPRASTCRTPISMNAARRASPTCRRRPLAARSSARSPRAMVPLRPSPTPIRTS